MTIDDMLYAPINHPIVIDETPQQHHRHHTHVLIRKHLDQLSEWDVARRLGEIYCEDD